MKCTALEVVHGVRAAARWADVAFIYWQIRLPVRRQRHSIVDCFDQLSINRKSFYILKSYTLVASFKLVLGWTYNLWYFVVLDLRH